MFPDADVNMDGRVNVLDWILIQWDMCLQPGELTENPRTDVNHDGLVDAQDWWMVYDAKD